MSLGNLYAEMAEMAPKDGEGAPKAAPKTAGEQTLKTAPSAAVAQEQAPATAFLPEARTALYEQVRPPKMAL